MYKAVIKCLAEKRKNIMSTELDQPDAQGLLIQLEHAAIHNEKQAKSIADKFDPRTKREFSFLISQIKNTLDVSNRIGPKLSETEDAEELLQATLLYHAINLVHGQK